MESSTAHSTAVPARNDTFDFEARDHGTEERC
jgi:hypothetical protein